MAGVELLSPPRAVEFPYEWYGLLSDDHFWLEWRLRAALHQVGVFGPPPKRFLKALDVGGGSGLLRSQLEAATNWTIDLADLNANALSIARPGRGRTLCYDLLDEHREFLGAYDLVLLFDVLEHIVNPRPFVDSLLRHLRPGGSLLVNVPALPRLFGAYDRAAGHVRRYDRRSLRREFAATTLRLRDIRYWGLSLIPLLALRTLLQRGQRSSPDLIRSGFEPPGKLANATLRGLMRLEDLFPSPPLGTSLLLLGTAHP